jgi:uncharacterized integral membrane protein (TIGR00697 family)|tara:strand:+ start:138 stop:761 length:624 start_codon:yes stop_codon:yes gene_type:complete
MEKREIILISLAVSFITCLLAANILAVKLINISMFNAVISAGIICYPLTFLLTDTISELYGKKYAGVIVWGGFGCNILLILFIYIAGILPYPIFWEDQESFSRILGGVPRIVVASMIAYIVSQNIDVICFHYIKNKTAGKYLWLRNNASTYLSQSADTLLFVTIAFWGLPMNVLIGMIITQYIIKLIIAGLDTPFIYGLVFALKKHV